MKKKKKIEGEKRWDPYEMDKFYDKPRIDNKESNKRNIFRYSIVVTAITLAIYEMVIAVNIASSVE